MFHRYGLRRTAAGLLAAAGAFVCLLFVVLPALASIANGTISVPPASTNGVTPTKYSINGSDCKAFYPSSGRPTYAYTIKDGTSKTYTDSSTGAKFTLTVNPPNMGGPASGGTWPAYATNKYFSFTSTGAAIVDVGVDGDNEHDGTRYNYSKLTGGSAVSDGYLHASALSTDKSGNTTKLDSLDDMTFCYNLGGVASGTVFADTNHNGTKDSGENGQSGWTVDLYSGSSGGASGATTATSVSGGSYSFKNLTIGGTYTVCLVGQAGYLPTVPNGSTGNKTTCQATGENPIGYTFTLSPNASGLNFGNVGGATISGSVFIDANGNGTNDSESGAPGLTVTLYDTTTSSSTSMPTDGDGNFSFAGQFVGDNYKVCTATPGGANGYTETAPPSGPACGGGQAPIGYAISSLTTSGSSGNTFGLEPNGSISGTVYNDANQNGANDNESGLPGWTINLYTGTSTLSLLDHKATDGSGRYSFTFPLSAGTQYTICEVPAGPPPSPNTTWAQSEPNPTSSPDVCNSNSNGELPKGHQVTPTSMSESDIRNFGNVPAQSGSNGSFSTDTYQVQLGTPKPNSAIVVNSGTTSDGKPYVSTWTGDYSGPQVPMIETITWPYPFPDQNAIKLVYTDQFPFPSSTAGLPAMPYCLRDPTSEVLPSWTPPNLPANVLPGNATSCLISTLIVAGQPFVAKVYSAVDGFRGSG